MQITRVLLLPLILSSLSSHTGHTASIYPLLILQAASTILTPFSPTILSFVHIPSLHQASLDFIANPLFLSAPFLPFPPLSSLSSHLLTHPFPLPLPLPLPLPPANNNNNNLLSPATPRRASSPKRLSTCNSYCIDVDTVREGWRGLSESKSVFLGSCYLCALLLL